MQVEFNKETFKQKARRQHEALKSRGVSMKLSDVMESMAVALDHRNLAHLYATFEAERSFFASAEEIAGWSRWVMVQDTSEIEETWALLPEGTTLADVASTNWRAVRKLLESMAHFPEGFVLGDKTTVLETFVESPSIDRYGMPMPADEHRVDEWVRDSLGFRVIDSTVRTSVHDRGDDGAESIYIVLALSEKDAERVRAEMFAS
ncbi:hypothetical protein [Burkholderia cenocepacia]|uniref:hypothetical protein n=1 Tax=Burkholderia cenocepacia TaxID=95486 RepID=UPI00076DA789|nr:hypothetical protein [Burkholderia cenocepacia]KWU24758.1 hypothetical protein AS149_31940 [Burkholderia cenocepacia]